MKEKIRNLDNTIFRIFIIVGLGILKTNQSQSNSLQNQQIKQVESNGNTQMLPYHQLPVYGNASLGYYYVNIYVGTPDPQPQSVIIDTGSGILAMPCVTCKQCGVKNHIFPPYDPTKSTSSKKLTCQSQNKKCVEQCKFKNKNELCSFSISYAQGSSLKGTLVQDDIRYETVGRNEQVRTSFGCTQKETKLFFQQKANGIFGLAPRRQSNLLQEMFKKHSLHSGQQQIFSLCLSSNGGMMTVGSANNQLHPEKLKPDISIPYNDSSNLYSLVGVKQMSMGETLMISAFDRIGGYGVFIDSGSTFSYIPQAKYQQVEKLLNISCRDSKMCSIGRGQDSICYKLNLTNQQKFYQQLDRIFPPVQINIQNKKLIWPATKYMLLRNIKRNQACMGLQPLNRYLLGANWMYDRDIVFDLSTKMVHIYDNVQCVKNAEQMGLYSSDPQNTTKIEFTNQTSTAKWTVNTKSTTFFLSMICLTLAIVVGFAITIVRLCNTQQSMVMIQTQQEHLVSEERIAEGTIANEGQVGNQDRSAQHQENSPIQNTNQQ